MQTLCSWFILNEELHSYPAFHSDEGGQKKKLPSHRDIQSTLVRIQDKPPSFLGSREWIGSYEICLCFDALYDVYAFIQRLAS